MRFADLPADVLDRVKVVRYDKNIEKHEGPFDWSSYLRYGDAEFIDILGRPCLLPLDPTDQLPNITVYRAWLSEDETLLTAFLKDTTYCRDDEPHSTFYTGRMAVCRKFEDHAFYLTVVYFECYLAHGMR